MKNVSIRIKMFCGIVPIIFLLIFIYVLGTRASNTGPTVITPSPVTQLTLEYVNNFLNTFGRYPQTSSDLDAKTISRPIQYTYSVNRYNYNYYSKYKKDSIAYEKWNKWFLEQEDNGAMQELCATWKRSQDEAWLNWPYPSDMIYSRADFIVPSGGFAW